MKEREEYRAEAHHALNKLFDSIENIEAKIKETAGEQKKQLEAKLDEMHEKKKTLENRFQALENATEDSWQDAKAGFEEARNKLSETWKEVKMNFKEA